MSVLEQRFVKAQALLKENELDAVVVTSPQNFFYFSGSRLDSQERLQAIVIPSDGEASVVVHEMFEQQVNLPENVQKVFWHDGDDAISVLAAILPGAGKVAIDNQWPSGNLIQLMDAAAKLTYAAGDQILAALRAVKDELEIRLLKESARYADQVMDSLLSFLKPGVTEQEAALELERLFKQKGVNQLSFDPVVAFGPNSAVPHHEPGDTVLKEGDIVVVDMGGIKEQYCSDITRTFVVGEPTAEAAEVYEVVRQAQDEAVKAIKPGMLRKEIDQAARNIITKAGYGDYFTHRTGHGIGMEVHEEPYLSAGDDQPLQEGMVCSVEPGIYLPGKFGVRIEDIVAVTANGAERLNNFPRKLKKI